MVNYFLDTQYDTGRIWSHCVIFKTVHCVIFARRDFRKISTSQYELVSSIYSVKGEWHPPRSIVRIKFVRVSCKPSNLLGDPEVTANI